jgi:hypothetical protein
MTSAAATFIMHHNSQLMYLNPPQLHQPSHHHYITAGAAGSASSHRCRSLVTFQSLVKAAAPSHTQLVVFSDLRHIPEITALELEVSAADSMYSVDILLQYCGRDIAVEVDGPFHFMLNRSVTSVLVGGNS